MRPVREIHIRVGESEGGEKEEQAGGQDTESELAGVIAAYLRVERSWVEVSIVE